ncbi:hypothetical protein K402DRAFT_73509 [Aulographum hederae CBS 113979]|uniref:Uncharacterized protein n=1 Tax=Aulographum hederae CBS 113979 TaxID=1176131 RepID=A0A6G1HG58_9PEZI|nr:hypothetical protein K402DRAFT_73509 [Aulographum hederae CBS 113979]
MERTQEYGDNEEPKSDTLTDEIAQLRRAGGKLASDNKHRKGTRQRLSEIRLAGCCRVLTEEYVTVFASLHGFPFRFNRRDQVWFRDSAFLMDWVFCWFISIFNQHLNILTRVKALAKSRDTGRQNSHSFLLCPSGVRWTPAACRLGPVMIEQVSSSCRPSVVPASKLESNNQERREFMSPRSAISRSCSHILSKGITRLAEPRRGTRKPSDVSHNSTRLKRRSADNTMGCPAGWRRKRGCTED